MYGFDGMYKYISIHIYIQTRLFSGHWPGINGNTIYLFSIQPVLVLYSTQSTIPTSSTLLLGLFAFRPHYSAFRSSLIVSPFPDGDFTVRVQNHTIQGVNKAKKEPQFPSPASKPHALDIVRRYGRVKKKHIPYHTAQRSLEYQS